MLQAITTKYFGPTNTRGARVKASCSRGSITVSRNHALSIEENHAEAKKALVEKFAKEDEKQHGPWKGQGVNPWLRTTAHGVLEDGRHVFVFTGESNAGESLVYALHNCR